jgi:dTDP-4-dehydrorhamnose 3,5-epimerase
MKVPLLPDVAKSLKVQQYGPACEIDGVFYQPLKKHRDINGYFMEFMRLTNGVAENLPVKLELRQISISRAVPNRMNAFHLHAREIQDETWSAVEGMLLVWLVDVRENSRTKGAKRRYILTEEEPALLYIPSGVAHGYKAGPSGALLVYAMNGQFNAKEPNEGRLPWDYFGRELWEDERG